MSRPHFKNSPPQEPAWSIEQAIAEALATGEPVNLFPGRKPGTWPTRSDDQVAADNQRVDDMLMGQKPRKRGFSVHGLRFPEIYKQVEDYLAARNLRLSCKKPFRLAIFDGDARRKSETLFLHVPCGKCGCCEELDRARWAQRATVEILSAQRSWHVVLTYSRSPTAKQAAADVEQFARWLRDNDCRFCRVGELGSTNGRFHVHLLVHETGTPVSIRRLKKRWTRFSAGRGFLDGREIDLNGVSRKRNKKGRKRSLTFSDATKAARYVAKYVTKSKSFGLRVSSSNGYGSGDTVRRGFGDLFNEGNRHELEALGVPSAWIGAPQEIPSGYLALHRKYKGNVKAALFAFQQKLMAKAYWRKWFAARSAERGSGPLIVSGAAQGLASAEQLAAQCPDPPF